MKIKIALGIGLLIRALCANSMTVDTLYFNTFGKVTIYQSVKSR